MSRSGTSFMQLAIYAAFGEEDLFWKMRTDSQKNRLLGLNEPTIFMQAHNIDRSTLRVKIGQIVENQKEFLIPREKGPLAVIKHPGLDDLHPSLLSEFDQVLVCSRKPESWLLSALDHKAAKGQTEMFCKRNNCQPLDYARHRYAKAKMMVITSKNAIMLDFHDTEGKIKKLSKCLGHPDDKIMRGVFNEHWTGSRYEK